MTAPTGAPESDGTALAVPPPASVLPALPSGLRQAAPMAAGLFGAALCTALAGLHLSRAHGAALVWHALAGVLGLLLALAAVVRAGHRAAHSRTWARLAIAAALVAVGIAAVDTAMLCWYAVARLLSST